MFERVHLPRGWIFDLEDVAPGAATELGAHAETQQMRIAPRADLLLQMSAVL